MMILYGVAVTSTRCRVGFGCRNRKFPRKETGVSTQGNNSAHVRKRQYPRKGTGVPPLETPVLKGGNNSTEGRKPARAQEEE
ncbi:hypothetical protein [Bacteroides clarus]|uniref:hypothetical protein n=1 Tax=Bacteroides clarus TaxID=626929 RepID=UPI002A7F952A|nr:hypothetical protein [Bacteroides clarus]